MIKAIIFDFDGVIGDTYDISFQVARDIHPNTTRRDFLGLFMGNVYETAAVFFTGKNVPLFFEKQKQAFTGKNFFAVQPMLEKLSKQYRLFIISGNIDNNIKYFLECGNLGGYFQRILGATTHRSKAERFKMVFRDYNLTPGECLFVTDTVGDIIEAKEVNIRTIAVSWGYHDEQLLRNQQPLTIAHTPDELVSIIESLT
jgi:phosphoglycolate phosphatase